MLGVFWVVIGHSGTCFSNSMDQPGKVANPGRGQLNRESEYSLSAFVPENLVSRDGFGSPVRVSLLISILRLTLVLTYGIRPEFRGGVHLFNSTALESLVEAY